jgi:hypothetical protein
VRRAAHVRRIDDAAAFPQRHFGHAASDSVLRVWGVFWSTIRAVVDRNRTVDMSLSNTPSKGGSRASGRALGGQVVMSAGQRRHED